VIAFSVKTTDTTNKVANASEKAIERNLFRSAARVRKFSMASIVRSPVASSAGSPPHTRRGNMRRAIVFDVDKKKQNAVVGPRYSVVGAAGAAHEFGESYRGDVFEERSFMGPALAEATPSFAEGFSGSIGE
jgi:hypothetical protein